jgi:hypothetical protein
MTLSNSELEDMRAAIEELLPSTCNILSPTYTPDGQGGGTITWGTITGGTAVPCRLDSKGGRSQIAGEAMQPFNSLVLSMPYDTAITESYRVEFTNERYIVTNVSPDDASWRLVRRVQLERII